MLGLVRGGCRTCYTLQMSIRENRGHWHNFYSRPFLIKSFATLSQLPNKAVLTQDKESEEIYDALIKKSDALNNIEHDIFDIGTFELVKEQYVERIQELQRENEHAMEATAPKAKKKFKSYPKRPAYSKYAHGNQLSYQAEQSVLAELDIYLYLGQITQAVNLFNYHRRHGHKFGIDAYNKIIHAWASQKSWKNIQMLLGNLKREGLEPNYQTYAALLEACGNLKDYMKTESVLSDMQQMNFDVNKLLNRCQLSKQQISSIIGAVRMVHHDYIIHKQKEFASTAKPVNENVAELIQSQLSAELKGTVVIQSVDKTKTHSNLALKRSEMYVKIIEEWRKKFITEVIKTRSTRNKRAFMYNRCVTFASVLTPDELADLVFEEIVPILCGQTQGVPVNFLSRKLGFMIYMKFCSKFKDEKGVTEKIQQISENYFDSFQLSDLTSFNPREKWLHLRDQLVELASEDIIPNMWPTKTRVMASSVVLDILKRVTTVDTSLFLKSKRGTVPSLTHYHEYVGSICVGMLKFHPAISRFYSCYIAQQGDITFPVQKVPIVIPPRPWTTANGGAYFLVHSDFVRTVSGQFKLNKLMKASENGDLDKIFDSLNYIGNCAWKINERLLDIMTDIFNADGNEKLEIIGPNLPYVEQRKSKEAMTYEERKSRQKKRKRFHELFALRMDQLYKLSVANHFRKKTFWVPNNLDFRGRLYPIAPHGSHIGNDLSRALLMFADGKKLGENGLDWLKVHLVNVHGQLKKSSLKDRIQYANENMDNIFDSADFPLTGRKWWQDGSDPWQTLVACMELTNAIRSGDAENFVSHMPVHQDGSCNGLQHYASLGRDAYGARQVNLMPEDRPQDVYLEVANLVEKARKADAVNGMEIAQRLEGKITRKVVKQTVMTIVYGVTFIGGRMQIQKQLQDLNLSEDILFVASVYVAKAVFKSITEMFASAELIQDWFTVSAGQIAHTGNCVDWVTPLGLPVIQPYHIESTEAIVTPLQKITATHSFDYAQLPHLRKQKGGFPPNFVHSLDATHLMMTALRCEKAKMTFASVHDSFWTHACDIEKMNIFCREEFVALHELPILQDLKKHFDETYGGLPFRKPLKDGSRKAKFADLPEAGTFDIKNVLKSVYFFS